MGCHLLHIACPWISPSFSNVLEVFDVHESKA
jgi:hypothetical protein